MKYKLMGMMACVLMSAIVAFTLIFNADEDVERYHQHLQAEEKADCEHTDGRFCTHLPLVQIETGGEAIPGQIIQDVNGATIGYTKAADGNDYITASFSVIDNVDVNNHVADEPALNSLAQIHVRGNSSRRFEKLGYAIRLVLDNNENNPQTVMGMDAHHEWILHGPYLDKTLIRNYMWYNIAGEIMDYAPNVRFCEVMIDGQYQGVYVMVESVSAGQDGARLNLSVDKKDNSFSGYLLRLDRGSETQIKNLNTFSMYSMRGNALLNVEYPGTSNITEELRRSIELDFSDFEKALYSYDYDSSEYGYPEYIDIESFVDYFVINEVSGNYDAGLFSTYIYKDIDGKYRLCVWDFNSACDNYQEQAWSGKTFEMDNRLWFSMLLKSDYFTDLCIERYKELRETILSDEYLDTYINETIDYLGDAVDRNFERWGSSFDEELLYPTDRNIHSFNEAVEQLKGYIAERTVWMDENIETLRQYSAESKTKKYSEGTE